MSFLDFETSLMARLEGLLPAGMRVLCAEDLASLEEASQPTPAVHVIYNGYRPTQSSNTGARAIVEQGWLVVVVVKHAGAAAKAAAEVKGRAAPLVDAVLAALMGWHPSGRAGAPGLRLATPPKPVFRSPFYYFPLAFTAEVAVEAPRTQPQ